MNTLLWMAAIVVAGILVLSVVTTMLALLFKFIAGLFGGPDAVAKMYSGRHAFRKVDPSEFPKVDRAFYDVTQAILEEEGFRFLADIEDTTVSEVYPNMRTFIRCMIGDDGVITAGIYSVSFTGIYRLLQLIGLLPKNCDIVDFETEFNDGTFLGTVNSEGLDQLDEPPSIRKVQYPLETDVEALLAAHRQTITQWSSEDSEYQPVHIATFEQVIESQHRMQELKNAYRAEIGLITREEMARMAGGEMTPEAEELLEDFKKHDEKTKRGE